MNASSSPLPGAAVMPLKPVAPLGFAPETISRRTWIAVFAVILGAFMAVLDIVITNASLRNILGTLSATQEEGSWVSTAYLCAEIIAIPLTSFFSNVFGVRAYVLANTFLFLVFSTLSET